MAQLKIYRAAYIKGDDEDAQVHFSGWVELDGLDEVEAEIVSAGAGQAPTVLGWEEMELDTEPI